MSQDNSPKERPLAPEEGGNITRRIVDQLGRAIVAGDYAERNELDTRRALLASAMSVLNVPA